MPPKRRVSSARGRSVAISSIEPIATRNRSRGRSLDGASTIIPGYIQDGQSSSGVLHYRPVDDD